MSYMDLETPTQRTEGWLFSARAATGLDPLAEWERKCCPLPPLRGTALAPLLNSAWPVHSNQSARFLWTLSGFPGLRRGEGPGVSYSPEGNGQLGERGFTDHKGELHQQNRSCRFSHSIFRNWLPGDQGQLSLGWKSSVLTVDTGSLKGCSRGSLTV